MATYRVTCLSTEEWWDIDNVDSEQEAIDVELDMEEDEGLSDEDLVARKVGE